MPTIDTTGNVTAFEKLLQHVKSSEEVYAKYRTELSNAAQHFEQSISRSKREHGTRLRLCLPEKNHSCIHDEGDK